MATPLGQLLGLQMVIGGGAGIAPELAGDCGFVALQQGGYGADRRAPLVQVVDLAALVIVQVAENPRRGGFFHVIGQSGP